MSAFASRQVGGSDTADGKRSLSRQVLYERVGTMKGFQTFLDSISDLEKRERLESILTSIKERFPQLKEEIKWNQPMFSDHGTYIIGFSIAEGHVAVAPEAVVISLFEKEIEEAGHSHTREIFRIKWTDNVALDLMHRMVAYNIEDKKDMTAFWRPSE